MHGSRLFGLKGVVHLRFKGTPCGAISFSIWIMLF